MHILSHDEPHARCHSTFTAECAFETLVRRSFSRKVVQIEIVPESSRCPLTSNFGP